MSATATATPTKPVLTDDQAEEILRELLDSNGPIAVDDLVESIKTAEDGAAQNASIMLVERRQREQSPLLRITDVGTIARNVLAWVVLAREGRTKLARMASLDNTGSAAKAVDPGGFPSAPSAEAETHLTILAHSGQIYIDALRAHLAGGLGARQAQLAQALSHLSDVKLADVTASKTGFHAQSPTHHDGIHAGYVRYITERDDLKTRVATIEAYLASAPTVQAPRVADVIAKAGGADAIATGIREALIVQGKYWSSDPSHPELSAKAASVAGLDQQLAQLDGAGSLAAGLAADRKQAADDHASAKAAADARLKEGIALIVSNAVAGDESARATIESLARSQPRAFPDGFADAIERAQFEYSDEAAGSSVAALLAATN